MPTSPDSRPSLARRVLPAAGLLTAVVLVSGTTGAVAGAQITGKQIKDNTVTSADIRDRTITPADTSLAFDRFEQRVGHYRAKRRAVTVPEGEYVTPFKVSCPTLTSILGFTAWWEHSTDVPQVVALDDGTRTVQIFGRSSAPTDDTVDVVLYCGATN